MEPNIRSNYYVENGVKTRVELFSLLKIWGEKNPPETMYFKWSDCR